MSQHAAAVAAEAQYKAAYNVAIVSLEEAKGTLLEHDQIFVADGPKPVVPGFAAPDFAVKRGWHPPPSPTPSLAPAVPAASAPAPPGLTASQLAASALDTSEPRAKEAIPKAAPGGKTYSFQFTIDIGSKPVEIRGSFTVTPAQSGDTPKVD
ncbi:MAG: hypothetical protein ACLQIB_43870 [Isosphaeraceae bacterium]